MEADLSSSCTDSDDDSSPFGKSVKFKNSSVSKATEKRSNFPLPKENTMIYRLYPTLSAVEAASSIVDYQEQLSILRAFAFNLSKDYIWHNEPFRLLYLANPKPHFYGQVNFEDNVDDEWFIVYLLFEISKNFPDYAISVTDSDGQFLLIEAADYIPSWLCSEIAENRVFISRGTLCIIPLSKHFSPRPDWLTDSFLNQLLADDPGHLFGILHNSDAFNSVVASDNVQQAIAKRIGGFPECSINQRHRFNCVLPGHLVAALNELGPLAISVAINAMSRMDSVNNMQPVVSFTPSDLMTTSLVLTRHLFAKLCSIPTQDHSSLGWKLPQKDDLGFKANELGIKLVKGIEIICAVATTTSKLSKVPPACTNELDKFLETLKILGYFEGLCEESNDYKRLLEKAKLMYNMQSKMSEDEFTSFIGTALTAAIKDFEHADKQKLRLMFPALEEDSDEWLNITPEDLDNLLAGKMKTNAGSSTIYSRSLAINGSVSNGDRSKEGKSGFREKGLQYATNCNNKDAFSDQPPTKGIDFNPDTFGDSIRRMLDLHIPHDGDHSSDMDSYGEDVSDTDEKGAEAADVYVSNIKRYADHMGKETKPNVLPSKTDYSKDVEPKPQKKIDETTAKSNRSLSGDSIELEDDDFTPVNIDKSRVSHILDSYFPESCGQTSSTSSLLHGDKVGVKKFHHSKEKEGKTDK